MKNTIYTIIAAALCLASCEPETVRTVFVPEGTDKVEITLECGAPVHTKSSLSVAEDKVSNANILVFDNASGCLDQAVYFSSTSGMSVTLVNGNRYDIYVLANVGDVTSTVKASYGKESTFAASYTHTFADFASVTADGFPMASKECKTVTAGSASSTTITIERLVARYDVKIDRSSLSGSTLTVKSVRVRQGALSFAPFASAASRKSSSVADGDFASGDDLTELNGGSAVSFYLLENRQGVLLEGNSDPWAKVPGSIAAYKDCCTYLEMTCSYAGPSRTAENVTYRMYLGGDATTDFSITRNTVYTLTLCPTDSGLDKTSWKIDPGEVTHIPEITYSYALALTPASASVKKGSTTALTATWYKYTYTDGVLTDTGKTDVTASATWTSSATGVATVSAGTVTGIAAGSATITASYGGKNATAAITISPGGGIDIGGDDDDEGDEGGGEITY